MFMRSQLLRIYYRAHEETDSKIETGAEECRLKSHNKEGISQGREVFLVQDLLQKSKVSLRHLREINEKKVFLIHPLLWETGCKKMIKQRTQRKDWLSRDKQMQAEAVVVAKRDLKWCRERGVSQEIAYPIDHLIHSIEVIIIIVY